MKQDVMTISRHKQPPPAGAGESARMWCLLCRCGAVLCALPVEQIVEIMRPLPVERIAGAPAYVRGLSVIRGVPVPVVDLGLIVGEHATLSVRLIAVKAASRIVAVTVDWVLGISAIAADALGQLPPLLRDTAPDTVAAIGATDKELIIFLQTARLVPEDVLAGLNVKMPAS